MTPYYCIIILLSIFCVIEQSREFRQYRFVFVGLFVLVLGCFAGFRAYDPDYYNYQQIYKDIGHGYVEFSDVGFSCLCVLLNYISANPILLFIVVAFFSIFLNLNSFYKYSPYIGLCILLYFVHNFALKEMIQIRAGLASALCLYSLRYLPKKCYKKAFVCLLLAISIQASSSVFGLVFILDYIKPTKKYIIGLIVLSLIIGTIYPLGQIIKNFTNIGDYSERAMAYVLYGDTEYAQSLGIWTNINTLKALGVCLCLMIYYDTLSKRFIMFKPILLSYVAGVCWLLCFNDFAIIGARMSNILMSGESILLSYPCILFSKNSKIFYILFIIIIAIIMFNLNIAPNKITPYKFYFQ